MYKRQVSGLVRNYRAAPMDFDRWAEDPAGGAEPNMERMDLVQRRNHILRVAFEDLEQRQHTLLARLAIVSEAADHATVCALDPYGGASDALDAALTGLEQRGLLRWDRGANAYELHPVVRGYALETLRTEELQTAGEIVADHFSKRADPPYQDAHCLDDLKNGLQTYRALVQAGQLDRAFEVYRGELALALQSNLGRRHEVLELLRPLFPTGELDALPLLTEPSDQAYALNEVARVFSSFGDFSRARDCLARTLGLYAGQHNPDGLGILLSNLAQTLARQGSLARSYRACQLSLRIRSRINDQHHARSWLDMLWIHGLRGAFDEAERAWAAFNRLPRPTVRSLLRPGGGERRLAWLRLYQGELDDGLLDGLRELVGDGMGRAAVQEFHQLAGELRLTQGRPAEAVEELGRGVAMAREVGHATHEVEARLALALARAGEHARARDLAASLERSLRGEGKTAVSLAEAHLELGDRDRAGGLALDGFRWAWADGPPFAFWWELQRSRAVLEALGEPEPELAPFDPEAVEPLPHEDAIEALLERLETAGEEGA